MKELGYFIFGVVMGVYLTIWTIMNNKWRF